MFCSTLSIKMKNKTRLISFAFGTPESVANTIILHLSCKQYLVTFQSKPVKCLNWHLKIVSGSISLHIGFWNLFREQNQYFMPALRNHITFWKWNYSEGAVFHQKTIHELKRKPLCCYTSRLSGKYIEQIRMFCPKAGKRPSDSQVSVKMLYFRKRRCSKLEDRVIFLLKI